MRWKLTRELFVRMLREEWRMHAHLFGGVRFAAFPVLIAALSTTAVWGLVQIGTTPMQIAAGIHALVLLFGLHTGSVGLVGRDAVRNLLGDLTLIIYSARTLPISRQKLLSIFLVKDVVYYSLLFLLPLTVAFAPATAETGAWGRLPLLWLTTTGMFLLGASITLALIGLSSRGLGGRTVGIGAMVVIAGLWMAGVDVAIATPYAVFESPSLASLITGFAAVPVLTTVGVLTYDLQPDDGERTAESRFRELVARLPGHDTALVAKTLLDLARSSGGVWKVAFSGGIIFGVSAAMIRAVELLLGVNPVAPVAMGAMLGLSAFTTYNWLTQFDALEDYLIYPVDVADVYRAKFIGFLVVGMPVGLGYYALAVAAFGGSAGAVAVGATLTVGVQLYLFGLTTKLAGLSPNEFMFDTVLYASFATAVGVVLVPVLIAGLVLAPLSTLALSGVCVTGIVAGIAGVGLYARAPPA